MRIAVDTNVLVYAEGLDDAVKQDRANTVLAALGAHDMALPLQCMAELHRVLMRRTGCSSATAEERVRRWGSLFPIHPETTRPVLDVAFGLVRTHRFQVFDAIVVAASVEAKCDLLLSEDMHDGFAWHRLTIANPLNASLHPLLADALSRAD